jgi:hypothetical protein
MHAILLRSSLGILVGACSAVCCPLTDGYALDLLTDKWSPAGLEVVCFLNDDLHPLQAILILDPLSSVPPTTLPTAYPI